MSFLYITVSLFQDGSLISSTAATPAAAYYYNYGAWGVGQTAGKSPSEIQEFLDGTLFTNQYVTCFVRFGRIFSGVGLVWLYKMENRRFMVRMVYYSIGPCGNGNYFINT